MLVHVCAIEMYHFVLLADREARAHKFVLEHQIRSYSYCIKITQYIIISNHLKSARKDYISKDARKLIKNQQMLFEVTRQFFIFCSRHLKIGCLGFLPEQTNIP